MQGKLTLPSLQAKQMYNSLQRHSTSGLTAASSSSSKDVDYDNVEDCGGGGAVGGGDGMGGIVVHGDSGDSGVIVRESRQPGGGGGGGGAGGRERETPLWRSSRPSIGSARASSEGRAVRARAEVAASP